jgi:hypothetical protein
MEIPAAHGRETGVTPPIILQLIGNTVFVRHADVAQNLPPHTERVQLVPPDKTVDVRFAQSSGVGPVLSGTSTPCPGYSPTTLLQIASQVVGPQKWAIRWRPRPLLPTPTGAIHSICSRYGAGRVWKIGHPTSVCHNDSSRVSEGPTR